MKKIVKYGASWCGPCRRQDKEFEDNPPKYDLEVVDVDTLEDDELESLNIKNVPTIILYDIDDGGNKTVIEKWYGFTKTEEINKYPVD